MRKTALSNSIQSIIAGSVIALTNMAVSQTAQAETFSDALTGGKPTVDVRIRYEGVTQDGKKDAAAFTERTRIGYKTGNYKGLDAFIEMSGTEALGARKDYFVPKGPDAGSDSSRAVVLDPTITTLNQAWIGYKFGETNLKAGKQRIIFDHRFLGNVGWRQTEQVYTGATLKTKAVPNTEIDYAYITNVRNPIGVDQTMASNAIQAKFTGLPFGKLTGYGYFLDYDLLTLTDSQTIGVRFDGKTKLSNLFKLFYHIEYASQGDYADSKNIGGDYTRAELGLGIAKAKILLGQEKLGGDGISSFQTPLGTVHAYNGWADMFIGPVGGTPVNGLIDNYVSISGKALGLKMAAIYHDFSADKGNRKYGTEYDLLVAKKFSKTYSGGIKYVNYDADKYAKDTTKLWVWGQMKF